jgi:hypothetical protein
MSDGLKITLKDYEICERKLATVEQELAEARRQVARADELLVAAEEWMSADGCDCGTDEIDTCILCRIRASLAAAQQAKEGESHCCTEAASTQEVSKRMKLDFVWVLIGIFAALWAWVWPWALIPIIGTSLAACAMQQATKGGK